MAIQRFFNQIDFLDTKMKEQLLENLATLNSQNNIPKLDNRYDFLKLINTEQNKDFIAIIETIFKSNVTLEMQISLLADCLKIQWEHIRTHKDRMNFSYNVPSAMTKFCFSLAVLLKQKGFADHEYDILMPTLKDKKNYFYNETIYELPLDHFIMDEKGEYPIPLSLLSDYFKAKKQQSSAEVIARTLINPFIPNNQIIQTQISPNDLKALIHFSKEGYELYEAYITHSSILKCCNTIYKYISDLKLGLEAGSIAGKGKELEASQEAYQAVIKFNEFIQHLKKIAPEKIARLNALHCKDTPGINFGTIWKTLTTIGMDGRGGVKYCSKGLKEKLNNILQNPSDGDILYDDTTQLSLIISEENYNICLKKFNECLDNQRKFTILADNPIFHADDILLDALLTLQNNTVLTQSSVALYLNRLLQEDSIVSEIFASGNLSALRIALGVGIDANTFCVKFFKSFISPKHYPNLDKLFALLFNFPIDSYKKSEIVYWAARNGLIETLNAIKKTYPDLLDSSYDNIGTPLHHAIFEKNINAAKILLSVGVNVNSGNSSKETPLFIAVDNKFTDAVTLLLSNNARLDVRDSGLNTVAIFAAENQNIEILRKILEKDEHLCNMTNFTKDTPLTLAAYLGNLECVNYLLTLKSINVNNLTCSNKTALDLAIETNRPKIVCAFIDYGVTIDKNISKRITEWAVEKKHTEVIISWLRKNLNILDQKNINDFIHIDKKLIAMLNEIDLIAYFDQTALNKINVMKDYEKKPSYIHVGKSLVNFFSNANPTPAHLNPKKELYNRIISAPLDTELRHQLIDKLDQATNQQGFVEIENELKQSSLRPSF